MASWAARDLLGAMTSVGRWACSIVQAMVALLPEPVMPSSVWNRSPRSSPCVSPSIALGWSPAGSNSDTTLNGWRLDGVGFVAMSRAYRGGVTARRLPGADRRLRAPG